MFRPDNILLLLILSGDMVSVLQSNGLEFLECTSTCSGSCNCCNYNDNALVLLEVDEACETQSTGLIKSQGALLKNASFRVSHPNSCLTKFPQNFCQFPTIKTFSLNKNKIRELPNVSCLKKLVILDMSYNRIEILKSGIFDSLGMLRDIYLSGNQIHTVELDVFHAGLHSINIVYLDNNKLTEADVWVLNITHKFCVFDLRSNQISKITNKAHFKLDNSETYGPGYSDLRYNNLTVWPAEVLENLGDSIQISLNKILHLSFDFRNNTWNCDCQFYPMMSVVDNIYKHLIRDHLMVQCNSPPNLADKLITEVKMSELICNVSVFCPTGCVCQNRPSSNKMVINCQNAGLTKMPQKLPYHERIYMYFQNNFISQLPALPYMKRIVYLDISNNNLSFISSSAFDGAHRLEYLNLSNNKLNDLPKSFKKLHRVTIDISNNTIKCSCANVHMCTRSNGRTLIIEKARLGCKPSVSKTKLIGVVLGVIITLLLTAMCAYFRHELLLLFYIYILKNCKRHTSDGLKYETTFDVFVIIDEDQDTDRLWVREHLLPYFDKYSIKSYISYRDGIPGEVTVDANITNLHNSRSVLAVVSRSCLRTKMFQLQEAYDHMIKAGNGRFVIIKRLNVSPSSVSNGHIRAMLRLRHFIHEDDQHITDKLLFMARNQQEF
ncbi:slit homolog 3 protein [Patella vulgata]|uniref:slit homolog 3 protein n=1 Tax=Patella vulgata TaxID=6465 RepID=UPI00218006F3|nr:slit homolog 3 protein [Patella vulgata]